MKSWFKARGRAFILENTRFSSAFDRLFPLRFRLDGNRDFKNDFALRYLRSGIRVYDVGGGKQPFLSPNEKQSLDCKVVGIDISENELGQAPPGSYDSVIAADITSFVGKHDADIVVCQALLEHVPNLKEALRSIGTILAPSGIALLFVPCRNAAFARLNLLLPERFKRWLLFSIFPNSRSGQGFRSYYNDCTPSAIAAAAKEFGLEVVETRCYHTNTYFSFFLPIHVIWRLWTVLVEAARLDDWCETFSMALVRPMHSTR